MDKEGFFILTMDSSSFYSYYGNSPSLLKDRDDDGDDAVPNSTNGSEDSAAAAAAAASTTTDVDEEETEGGKSIINQAEDSITGATMGTTMDVAEEPINIEGPTKETTTVAKTTDDTNNPNGAVLNVDDIDAGNDDESTLPLDVLESFVPFTTMELTETEESFLNEQPQQQESTTNEASIVCATSDATSVVASPLPILGDVLYPTLITYNGQYIVDIIPIK